MKVLVLYSEPPCYSTFCSSCYTPSWYKGKSKRVEQLWLIITFGTKERLRVTINASNCLFLSCTSFLVTFSKKPGCERSSLRDINLSPFWIHYLAGLWASCTTSQGWWVARKEWLGGLVCVASFLKCISQSQEPELSKCWEKSIKNSAHPQMMAFNGSLNAGWAWLLV